MSRSFGEPIRPPETRPAESKEDFFKTNLDLNITVPLLTVAVLQVFLFTLPLLIIVGELPEISLLLQLLAVSFITSLKSF